MARSRFEKFEAFTADLMLMLAHGMKNRLANASTYVQLLEDPHPMSPESMLRFEQLARDSVQSSIQFYDRLYEVSQTEPGGVEMVDLGHMLHHLASAADIEVDLSGEISQLHLDTGLWSMIVQELFNNVRMHGGGRATVAVSRRDDLLSLRICDQGPGLTSFGSNTFEELSRQVVRATRRRQQSPGHGLGFTRVQWALLMLDGELTLEQASPRGLCTTVSAHPAAPSPE